MKCLYASTLILAFSVCVGAQEERLTTSEVNKITNSAYALQRTIPSRVSYSEQEHSKDRNISFVEVTERTPDGSFRSVRTTNDGKSSSTTEKVVVGGQRFVRTNGQPWAEDKTSGSGSGGPPGTTRDYSVSAKVKRNERMNQILVDVYQVTRHFIFEPKGGMAETHDSVSRYWIDKSDRLIRTEIRKKKRIGDEKEEINSNWDFEYDPNIRIEAPIK